MQLPLTASAVTLEWELLELTDPEGDGNPPAMHFTDGAYDPVRQRFAFYGGKSNQGGTRVPGLWEFNGTSWIHFDQSELLEQTTADWDPVAQKILFTNGTNPGFGVDFGRTWDGESMVVVDPSDPEGDGNIGGSGVQGASGAFDTASGKLVVYGGTSFGTVHADTWEWTGASWRKLLPTDVEGDGNPGPRVAYVMEFDETRQEIFLFGGQGTGSVTIEESGAVWGWNGTRWRKYVPTDPEGDGNPPGVSGSSFVYHPGLQRCVLMGGATAAESPMSDVWLWDGTSWEKAELVDQLQDGNHIPGYSPAGYMDSLSGIVVHSGAIGGDIVSKTWLLSNVDGVSEGDADGEGEGGVEGEGETSSDITFSRTGVPSNTYAPGGTVDIRVRVEYDGTLTALSFSEAMPAGWTYVQMVGGDIPEISPANGASGVFDFAYVTPPPSPVEFTYRVRAPISAAGDQTILGEAQYRRNGGALFTPEIATVFSQGAASEPISGIVRDGRTNGPLAGASVTLYRSGTSQVLDTAATAGNGSYEVSAPDAATNVDLLFAAQGFQARRISRINAPSTVSLTLEFVAPPAPTGLEAFPAVDSVTLTWQPSAALDVAGYYLYRGEGENPVQFDVVNSQPVADTRFEDVAGLVRGDVYTYFVTAVDFDGNESEPSETAEANPGTVVMWIPNLNALPGTALRVPLNVRNASGLQISGMQLDFRYPAAWLGADAPAQAAAVAGIKVEKTVLTQSATIQVNKDTPGRVVISGLDTGGKLVGEGHLFNVFLPVAPGVTPDTCELLSFQSAVFATNTIPPQSLPVDFTRSGLGCIDNTCFTGDLNGDGFSNVIDVLYALQVSAQLLEADTCTFKAGEMDGDGGVNSGDAILIWRSSIGAAVNPPQNTKSGEATVAQYWRNKGGTPEAAIGTAARNGTSAILPVALSNAAGISGLDLAITFPEAEGLVSLESVTQTGIASDFDLEVNEATGQVLISMSRAEALEEDAGDILLLEFSVSETAPAGAQLPIVLSAADLRGEYGENLKWFGEVGRADGAILVGGAAVIDGHLGDWTGDNAFSLSEVLRLVQFYNVGSYGCDAGTEDGFAPGSPDRICSPHTADYQTGADWSVSLNELLRVIQLFNAGGFSLCEQGEDGFCLEE